jgi:uncharacterized protein
MKSTPWLRVLGTLFGAGVAAQVCVWLHTPIPWMLGPLLATAVVSMFGVRTASQLQLRNAGQWVIGTALGLYFTPQVGALVAGLWWAVVVGVLWALGLGAAFGAWLYRVHAPRFPKVPPAAMRATTYYAGSIGGASEMTLLAERAGARTDLVASAHSLRVLMVTVLVPFGMQFWGVTGLDVSGTGFKTVSPPGLVALLCASACGGWVMHKLGRANPWFMGALLVAMVLTLMGHTWSALPTPLTNAAQLVIGVSLGVRFRPAFLHTAPRWLGSVALATVVMLLLCLGFAWGLSLTTGLHLATLALGTAPGGIAEMAITAKVLQLGVPVVTAFQACRLVAVLLLAEPVFRWTQRGRRTEA